MRYELLVFDWDGTLIDSAGAIVSCIQAACRDLGLPVPDETRASHVIGLGLKDALSYAIPGLPPADYGRVAECYRKHFLARDPDIALFPGAEAMLAALRERGHVLAIATGKSRAGLARALENTGLRTLMIGDTVHDLRMAASAGVPAVGVSYGAHPRSDLAALDPLACVDDIAELTRWLAQNA
jgi:phosphoglycolate phosphatase